MKSRIIALSTVALISTFTVTSSSQGSDCPVRWIGEPDPDQTIAQISRLQSPVISSAFSTEMAGYTGDEFPLPNLFETARINGGDFVFEPPIDPSTNSAHTFGDAYFGSAWQLMDGKVFIHRGIDLAVGAKSNTQVRSISGGTVYFTGSGEGDIVVIRTELEQDQLYPIEYITSWQDAQGNRIEPNSPPPDSTEIYPLDSHIEPFKPSEGIQKFTHLFISYQHLVKDANITTGTEVNPGTILGTINTELDTPHLHLQTAYSTRTKVPANSVWSGITHFTYSDIKGNISSASPEMQLSYYYEKNETDHCKRDREDTGDWMTIVNPLHLLYLLKEPTTSSDRPFVDVEPDSWYEEAVIELWKRKIIKGRSPGVFAPNEPVTRVELLKMAVLTIGESCNISSAKLQACVDSTATPWYASCLEAAQEATAGDYRPIAFWRSAADCSNGDYGLCCTATSDCSYEDNIAASRADAARILAMAADPRKWRSSEPISPTGNVTLSDVPEYLQPLVEELISAKIVTGYPDGTFRHQMNINRSEAAAMIHRGIESQKFTCPN